MKLFQARSLSKPWRIAAALLAIVCIICTYSVVALGSQLTVEFSPFVPALLALVFGFVAVSGRAPV